MLTAPVARPGPSHVHRAMTSSRLPVAPEDHRRARHDLEAGELVRLAHRTETEHAILRGRGGGSPKGPLPCRRSRRLLAQESSDVPSC